MKKHFGNIISWSAVFIVLSSIILITNNILPLWILLLTVTVASILDAFDGRIARMYATNKNDLLFGEITDSLCDIINFGIAPIYILIIISQEYIFLSLLVSLFYIWSILFRLARFSKNKTKNKNTYFDGLPVTVTAPLSILLTLLLSNFIFFIYIIYIVLAILMISELKIKKL